jgi:hypothetical protein
MELSGRASTRPMMDFSYEAVDLVYGLSDTDRGGDRCHLRHFKLPIATTHQSNNGYEKDDFALHGWMKGRSR